MVQLTSNSTRAWTIVAAHSLILESPDFPPEKLAYLRSVLSSPRQRELLKTDPHFCDNLESGCLPSPAGGCRNYGANKQGFDLAAGHLGSPFPRTSPPPMLQFLNLSGASRLGTQRARHLRRAQVSGETNAHVRLRAIAGYADLSLSCVPEFTQCRPNRELLTKCSSGVPEAFSRGGLESAIATPRTGPGGWAIRVLGGLNWPGRGVSRPSFLI